MPLPYSPLLAAERRPPERPEVVAEGKGDRPQAGCRGRSGVSHAVLALDGECTSGELALQLHEQGRVDDRVGVDHHDGVRWLRRGEHVLDRPCQRRTLAARLVVVIKDLDTAGEGDLDRPIGAVVGNHVHAMPTGRLVQL